MKRVGFFSTCKPSCIIKGSEFSGCDQADQLIQEKQWQTEALEQAHEELAEKQRTKLEQINQ